MAGRKQYVQLDIAIAPTIGTPDGGFIAFVAKSDGLYQKTSAGVETRLATLADITGGDVSVNQTSHGLSVGNAIRVSGANTFVKAQADSATNAEVIGYVTVVTDANNFKYSLPGIVTTGVPAQSAGTVMFLDPATAGALTAIEPTTTGQVSKPLLIIVESGTKAVFVNFRGLFVGGSSSGAYTVSSISANTTAVKNTLYVLTANLTLTLPATPTAGDGIKVSNLSGVLTCVIARNSEKIMGLAEDLTLDKTNTGFEMVYINSTVGWVII